jgi:adenylate kinase family enzyme
MELQTIIFIGRSGAGKGVQSALLQKFLNEKTPDVPIIYFETGQYFRKYMQSGGYTWDRARSTIVKGERQPDFLAVWIWANNFIEKVKGGEHLIFDGTPRSLWEAKMLHTALPFYERIRPVVIHLEISREEAEKRLRNRGRADDVDADAIKRRFAWYERDVVPAVDFYREDSAYHFLEINGEQSPEDVHQEIVALLTSGE